MSAAPANAMELVCKSIQSSEFKAKVSEALPKGVDVDRFTRTTLTAIQNNPAILECDRTSLYNAIVRCAQDGLSPDGREAVLTQFNTKVGNEWVKKAVCMPMVFGVIKQLGKAGITAYAASVYEGEDIEVWNDEVGQHIKHRPDPFATDRKLVGVYAVARTDKGVTYVETLGLAEIDKIRRASKSPDKGPWAEWTDRMAQKSALHRVAKRMPILDQRLADALRREDDDLTPDHEPVATQAPPAAPSRPQKPSVLNRLEMAPAVEPIRVVPPAKAPEPAPIVTVSQDGYDEGEVL